MYATAPTHTTPYTTDYSTHPRDSSRFPPTRISGSPSSPNATTANGMATLANDEQLPSYPATSPGQLYAPTWSNSSTHEDPANSRKPNVAPPPVFSSHFPSPTDHGTPSHLTSSPVSQKSLASTPSSSSSTASPSTPPSSPSASHAELATPPTSSSSTSSSYGDYLAPSSPTGTLASPDTSGAPSSRNSGQHSPSPQPTTLKRTVKRTPGTIPPTLRQLQPTQLALPSRHCPIRPQQPPYLHHRNLPFPTSPRFQPPHPTLPPASRR